MKKTALLSIAVATALNASSSDESSGEGKVSGELHVISVNQNNQVDTDTHGTSIGGVLKYESPSWNDLNLGVGIYVSQKLHVATGSYEEGKAYPDLFGKNTASYAYIGEGYMDYSANDFALRVGRQVIESPFTKTDTPFADIDLIYIHPISFEAAISTYSGMDKTTLLGGYVTRRAGYTGGIVNSKFEKLGGNESNGASIFGIVNESIDNLELQGWYSHIDRISNIFYADATYKISFGETMQSKIVGQYAHFKEENNSGIEGNVYGFGTSFTAGMVTVAAAYNNVSNKHGKVISNSYGGEMYIVSTEEMEIDGYEDVSAYQLSAELDMKDVGLEDMTLTALYCDYKSAPADMKVNEINLIATYEINEAIKIDMSYAMINDINKNILNQGASDYSGSFDRLLVRLNYIF